jgi:hypothetical protein
MRQFAALSMLLIVSACSSESREQIGVSTAAGAALGLPGGPIGVAVGTVVGAMFGLIMQVDELDNRQIESKSGAVAQSDQ